MDKQQVLDTLNAHRDRLSEFAVKALFLFGLVARDEATPESDVDVDVIAPDSSFTPRQGAIAGR